MAAMGLGGYGVSNDIVNGGDGQDIPTFGNGGMQTVTLCHKEYISDVFAPASFGTFQNTVYSINPGIERTFPWLSQVAANYEEYTLKQCIFTFRSTVTDFVATNGQVGTIIMATQYNPSDTPFQSKQDAMEYESAMSGKCSSNMMHGVECDPEQLSGAFGKYVRAGPVRASDDLKQYDWGNLNIGISNIPKEFENQSLGELWVSYTIELRKPKFFVTRGLNILRDIAVGQGGGTAGSIINNLTLGLGQQNRIGGQFAYTPNQLTYRFPATFAGTVRVVFSCDLGTATAATPVELQAYVASNLTASGLCTGILPIADIWHNGAWTYFTDSKGSGAGSTSSIEMHLMIVTPTTSGATSTAVQDNVLTFQPVYTPASTVIIAPVTNYTFEVEVYNAGGFNYPVALAPQLNTTLPIQGQLVSNGQNQVIENPVTGQIETWP